MDRLYRELERKGLRFRPHVWLSSAWFSPDGVPGIAVPFYLAHPRLVRLERAQMLEVEGGTEIACMRLLRHEAGHAIDTAYRLHHRKLWRETFGSFRAPYKARYTHAPYTRSFVLHLHPWYAQSHPAEDYAETFAVWLTPRSKWRERYAGWEALEKLEAVETMMRDIADRPRAVRSRERTERSSTLRLTLREHYAQRKARYRQAPPQLADPFLRRLFAERAGSKRSSLSAAAFLRENRRTLRRAMASWTGLNAYSLEALLEGLIERCEGLGLRVPQEGQAELLTEATVTLTVIVMNHLHAGHLQLPR